MIFSKLLSKGAAKQLAKPSGLIGTMLMAPYLNRRNAFLNNVAFDNLYLTKEDRVLEIGFGGGFLLGKIVSVVTKGIIAGIDISEDMVNLCIQKYKHYIDKNIIDLKCSPAEIIPYPSGIFNKVCSVNTVFYFRNISLVIEEIHRTLRKKGKLVLCFADKDTMSRYHFTKHGINVYTAEDMYSLLETAHFENITITRSAINDTDSAERKFLCITCNK